MEKKAEEMRMDWHGVSTSQKIKIHVVALTANTFEEDRQKAFEAGMNGHLAKPIDISKLTETLSSFFRA